MIKKFLIGTFAVAALAFAMTVSASYDFGTTTLRVGSQGDYVKTLQTLVGAGVDGNFGPITKAKVMSWQAANGLVADGLFGPASKAKANLPLTGTTGTTLPAGCQAGWAFNPATGASCTTGTVTPVTPGNLTGGAGDADIAHYSTSEKNSMKEGEEGVKVLGFKVEAIDSDIAVSFVKVEVSNTAGGTSSERLSNYVDSVDIMKGSTKVGSVDASEFTRDTTTGSVDLYTKTIALTNAVVKEGDKDAFYVVFNGNNSIDTDDMTAKLTVKVLSYRFQDATGVVFTNTASAISNVVSLEAAGIDDKIELKSSTTNPDDATVTVDETDVSDSTLALAFKLDVGDDSSDVKINELPITLTIAGAGATVTSAESIIDSVTVKAFGETFTYDLSGTGALTAGNGTATYSYDLTDSDVNLNAGDVEDVKVYIVFAEQKGNYAAGTTVTASVTAAKIEAETDTDDSFAVAGSTSQTGAKLTLSLTAAAVTGEKWVVNTPGTIIDFMFTVNADNADFNVLAADITSTIAKSAGATVSAVTLTKSTGDTVTPITGGFTVPEGSTTTFRARYDVSGTNGNWAEVKVTSVAGQAVPQEKQVSPTATVNGL